MDRALVTILDFIGFIYRYNKYKGIFRMMLGMIWIRYRSTFRFEIFSYKLSSSINKIQVVLYTVLKIEFTKHSTYLLRIEQNVSTHFNTPGHWKQNTYCFTVWVIRYFYAAFHSLEMIKVNMVSNRRFMIDKRYF